jgi:exosortase O
MNRLLLLLLLPTWAMAWPEALSWLLKMPGREDLIMQGIGMLAVIGVAGWQLKDRLALNPRWEPALVAAGALAASVALHRVLASDLIDVLLFILGSYGLSGLVLAPVYWKRALPLVLALVLILPLDRWFDAYLGFPARALTAEIIAQGFQNLGLRLDSSTVIRLDTPTGVKLASVDVPCSGVKSLWTGSLFLLVLIGLQGQRLGLRAVSGFIGLWSLLFASNLLRVGVLVGLWWAGLAWLADRAHTLLGLIGFMGSILAVGWWVREEVEPEEERAVEPKNAALGGLFAAVLGLPLLDTNPMESLKAVAFKWQAPSELVIEDIELSTLEKQFFAEFSLNPDSPDYPAKYRIEKPLSGSLMLVPARSWRLHHLPEHCQAPLGLKDSRQENIDGLYLRAASNPDHTLIWWFVAPDRQTDDLFARAWLDITGQAQRWVLVLLLLDGTPDFSGLVQSVHTSVQTSFLPEPV